MFYGWRPYVPVATRRRAALRAMEKLRQKGHAVAPVVIQGRTIAKTFWGRSWCQNLEGYSDFANRLPRGRTYVRNGSVVDLQIAPGRIDARVAGSVLYTVLVQVAALPKARWSTLCRECAGSIDSLVELLAGRFSNGVMDRVCRQRTGLFPSPSELQLACSCPDWATMCKHVAAVLYAIGARLDEKPDLLFTLRRVEAQDLIAKAGDGLMLSRKGPAAGRVLPDEGLSELFGIEMAETPRGKAARPPAAPRKKEPAPLRRGAVKGVPTRARGAGRAKSRILP
jgi:SWIM zinc finger